MPRPPLYRIDSRQTRLQSVSPDPGSRLFPICFVALQNFLTKFFSDHFLISPLTSLKIWCNCVVYFGSWTIWHVIEFLFHGNGVKESCNFEKLLHAKWSNFANTHKKSTKFSGMLGEDKKMIREKFCQNFLKCVRANWKKSTPRIW